MTAGLPINRDSLAALCRRHSIRRPSLFGSALKGTAGPDSDVDTAPHALDASNAAMRFVEGRDRADLESDEMLLFALVRAIEIVGEALSRVTAETRAELPDLPWASIVGMRNRLVSRCSCRCVRVERETAQDCEVGPGHGLCQGVTRIGGARMRQHGEVGEDVEHRGPPLAMGVLPRNHD
jgi:predicted nucleotidyltransferase